MSTGIVIGVLGTLLVLSSPWWLGELVGLAYEGRRKWTLYRLRHDDEWAHTEPAMPWAWSTVDNKNHLARGVIGMDDTNGMGRVRTVRIGAYRKHVRDIVRGVENAWMAGVEEEQAKRRRAAQGAEEVDD